MESLTVQNFSSPHETRPFQANGQAELVTLGDFTLGRGTFEPGWKWSNDVKPIAGTDSCQTAHTGYVLSGEMTVRMDDGVETKLSPGDVVVIPPGHDAWVDADAGEPCIMLDAGPGITNYAKAAE